MKKILVNKNGTFKVLSSSCKAYYDVNQAGHCSCPGFGFHRGKCKHVESLRKAGYLKEEQKVTQKGKGNAGTRTVAKFVHGKNGLRVILVPA